MRATVYMLVDPRDGAIKYIGETTLPLKDRLNLHLGRATCQRCLFDWIHDLTSEDLEPAIIALEETDDPDAERQWIRLLLLKGHNLLNETPNGKPGYPR